MDRLSFSVSVSILLAGVDANIIYGTVRVDLHTAVVTIIVDVETVCGEHRLIVVGGHGGQRWRRRCGEGKKRGESGASNPETATLSRRLGEHG
jgi:hypothetical protein